MILPVAGEPIYLPDAKMCLVEPLNERSFSNLWYVTLLCQVKYTQGSLNALKKRHLVVAVIARTIVALGSAVGAAQSSSLESPSVVS